jgi:hypothetical protein
VVTCRDEASAAGSAWLGDESWEKTCGAASENASARAAKQTRRNLPQKLDLVGASRQYFMLFPGWFSSLVESPPKSLSLYQIPSHLEERENHGVEYDVKSSISVLK